MRLGHVVGGHHRPQRHGLDALGVHRLRREAAVLRLEGDDAPDALPLHVAGADRVDADAVRAELHGQRLDEADEPPLRGDVGRTKGQTHRPGVGRHDDDGPPAGGLEVRHGRAHAEEGAGEVDVQRPAPAVQVHVLDRRGGTRHAGVADEHVEAAEVVDAGGHERVHLSGSATSATWPAIRGCPTRYASSAVLVRVTDVDARRRPPRTATRSWRRCRSRPP